MSRVETPLADLPHPERIRHRLQVLFWEVRLLRQLLRLAVETHEPTLSAQRPGREVNHAG